MTVPAPGAGVPETRYARNGDVHIAHQVVGDAPLTLVGVPGLVSNVELAWEDPDSAAFMTALAGFSRWVTFDKRGQGLSDRDRGVPTLDERLEDLTAVIDAADADVVALAGLSEGGATAAMYAASHPERVSHLVLFGSFARIPPELGDPFFPRWAAAWGTPETLTVRMVAPDKLGDARFLRWMNRFERGCTTPTGVLDAWRWIRATDVRPVLGSIRCPTLVMHRRDDRLTPLWLGRELADGIPGARLVGLDGAAHSPQWGGHAEVVAAVEEFLTGRARAPARSGDRVLATVLFTDIVDSTARTAASGDAAWRALLDRHDAIAAGLVEQSGGRLVKGTGDGVLATFDAPSRALRCAGLLRSALDAEDMPIRAGLHTGEIEVRETDIAGIAVNLAARVAALAAPGEILASRTVRDLAAGAGHRFASRGTHALKGVPEAWELFAVS